MTKVIILAAGQGKRLLPKTKHLPKCLVDLGGKPLLIKQIELLHSLGLNDISVVTGYLSKKILNYCSKYKFNTIHNEHFKTTNMTFSLFYAINLIKNKLNKDIIIIYGDIIYTKNVITKLVNARHNISVVIDSKWYDLWKMRMENPLDDAETLIIDRKNNIKEIGKKTKNINKIQGQYIGMFKINKNFINYAINIFNSLSNSVKNNLYLTDYLQIIINKKIEVKGVLVNGEWFEVDTLNDLRLYKKKYKKFFDL